MLITFSTPAYRSVTLFGDVGLALLKMMGRNDTVPSALYAEDVQSALDSLKAVLTRSQSQPPANSSNADHEDDEIDVSLSLRALPLIELLEAAAQQNCNVMWDKE
jgi:hypothetical protein